MKMSKNQVVMVAIGAVAVVASLALGYLAFDAYSSKGEAVEESESFASTIQRLLRGEVSPVKDSELAYKKNADALAGWSEAAIATASIGDRAVKSGVNAAAFKQQLVDEARALSGLEGGVDGKIVKPDFTFGFPDFVTGDKLPEEGRLPQLQRQWGDIRLLVEMLQACGVVEIVAIGSAVPAAAAQKTEEDDRPRSSKKKRGSKKANEDEKPAYTVEQYSVDFRAKPAALVKVVNALATSDRFVVVDSFSFAREADMIGTALGEGEKGDSAQPQQGRRRRRGRRAAAEEEAEEKSEGAAPAKDGIVSDPAREAPFLVKMAVSTYDFGAAEKPAAPAGTENQEDKKEEEE